jgi:hypothetical protein
MKKSIFAALVTLPVVVAGVFVNTGSAVANALTGIAQFSSEATEEPDSLVSITNDSVFFTPNPGNANIGFATESFVNFDELSLFSGQTDPTLVLGTTGSDELFLDFGTNAATITDGLDIFKLTSVSNEFMFDTQIVNGFALTDVGLSFGGYFVSAGGGISQGAGTLTFQAAGVTEEQIRDQIAATGSFDDMTFSGAVIGRVDVPEPTTILGLGVVTGSLALSGIRKKKKA